MGLFATGLVFFACGVAATLGFQYARKSTPTADIAFAPPEVPSAAFDDFRKQTGELKTRYALSDAQLSWVVFRHGFSGFFEPLMKKASAVTGTNYSSTAWGDANTLSIAGQENRTLGPRTNAQLAVLDTRGAKLLGTVDLGTAAMEDLDFLVFAPNEIRQFGMSNVYGVKYGRTASAPSQ